MRVVLTSMISEWEAERAKTRLELQGLLSNCAPTLAALHHFPPPYYSSPSAALPLPLHPPVLCTSHPPPVTAVLISETAISSHAGPVVHFSQSIEDCSLRQQSVAGLVTDHEMVPIIQWPFPPQSPLRMLTPCRNSVDSAPFRGRPSSFRQSQHHRIPIAPSRRSQLKAWAAVLSSFSPIPRSLSANKSLISLLKGHSPKSKRNFPWPEFHPQQLSLPSSRLGGRHC